MRSSSRGEKKKLLTERIVQRPTRELSGGFSQPNVHLKSLRWGVKIKKNRGKKTVFRFTLPNDSGCLRRLFREKKMYKIERNIQPIFYSNHDSSACHDEIGIKNREREGSFFCACRNFPMRYRAGHCGGCRKLKNKIERPLNDASGWGVKSSKFINGNCYSRSQNKIVIISLNLAISWSIIENSTNGTERRKPTKWAERSIVVLGMFH